MLRSENEVRSSAHLLLRALRALLRSQQISNRADVECCGVTVAGAAAMHVLHLEGPMRPSELSRRLGIAHSTLTRNIERIEARGLVARVADPADGRALRVELTAEGERAAEEIEAQNVRFAEAVLDQLGPVRRQQAVDGLLDLLSAIAKVAGSCCPDELTSIRELVDSQAATKEEER